MSAAKRLEIIDVFRGMAVLGFIIWHAFDLFYSGNEYKSSIFRACILTRISFIIISATVLGLKKWSNYKIGDHLRRSIKIMMYPISIGILKAIALKTLNPVIQIIIYPIFGSGHFTFSILIALGLLYLLLPLLLKYRAICCAANVISFILILLEFFEFFRLSEFWQFVSLSIIFTNIGKFIVRYSDRYSELKINVISCTLLLINIFLFSAIMAYEDFYWSIRNYSLFQLLLLLFAIAGLTSNSFLLQKIRWLKQIFLSFGDISLFVYIGHYVFFVILSIFIGFNESSVFDVCLIAVGFTVFFTLVKKLFKQNILRINRIFF